MGIFASKIFGDSQPRGRVALAMRNAGVQRSPELERILNLARRHPSFDKEIVDKVNSVFQTSGNLVLRPVQAVMLYEAALQNGLIAGVGVGFGKTLVSLLLPTALQSKCTVLLVKPELREQLLTQDIPFYSQGFNLPLDTLKIVAYSELSSPNKAEILETLQPDLIIADEMHNLRRKDSARTKRFLRYFKNHPETRFCGLTGSLTTRTIKDYAHLAELALRHNSPIPYDWRTLTDWADALDPPTGLKDPMRPGALLLLCNESDFYDKTDTEAARSGFKRRLRETSGVVTTSETSCGSALYIRNMPLAVPKVVSDTLIHLRETWEIGQEEITDAMSLAKYARQVSCGFYYRWVWENGVVDYEWLEARSAWHKEMRNYLLHRSRQGIDSPLLYTRAVLAGRVKSASWEAWDAVRTRKQPPTEAVWLDDFLIQDVLKGVLKWSKDALYGIIWYYHDALGRKIAELGSFPLYGQGVSASSAIPDNKPVIVCSIRAQGEGKNLQGYSRSIITSPPANATAWEQVIGRTHRPGQLDPEVYYDTYLHTEENCKAVETALEQAKYVEETTEQKQKMLLATWL